MTGQEQGAHWEQYWSALGDTVVVPWDTDPKHQADQWCAQVGSLMVPGLPLVDIPCGHGRHTWWLARYFAEVVPEVVGVDVSAAAVARARGQCDSRQVNIPVSFEVADILDADAVTALAARVGPANVWTRFLLHLLPEDNARHRAVTHLGVLAGGRGRIFNYELLRQRPGRMDAVLARYRGLADVFSDTSPPAQLNSGRLVALYRDTGFRVLATDRDSEHFLIPGDDDPYDCEWIVAEHPPNR